MNNWLANVLTAATRPTPSWLPWSPITAGQQQPAANALAPQSGTGGPLAAVPPGGGVGSGGPLIAPPVVKTGPTGAPYATSGPYMQAPAPGSIVGQPFGMVGNGGGMGTGGPLVAPGVSASPVGAPAGVPSAPAGVAPSNALAAPKPVFGGGGNMATPEIIAATGHPTAPGATVMTGFGIPQPMNKFVTVSPYQLGLAR